MRPKFAAEAIATRRLTRSGDLEEAEQTIVRLLQDAVEYRNGDRDDSPVPVSHGRQPEATA